MKTIASCVEDILIKQPFLEEALFREIINFSALSEELQDPVSKMLGKPVKTGAIMMALRRYAPPVHLRQSHQLKAVLKQLGDITVRSNLIDYTFQNSDTLIKSHTKLIETLDIKSFYGFSRGIYESNIVVSESEKRVVLESFQGEKMIDSQDNLSAISIRLPKNNSRISGLYYQIFKRFAWEGISLYEVISTTNEFTVLVESHLVDQAFSAIKNLNAQ
ncbi:hypothetical protein DFQ05_1761 [Winogradskyella wandonensis]|uniref:Aspartate kinase n=1 Tax=Winogradskyella wandonensis TaxID=1442586 RepID=A0A4R1KTW4_9FLAO|nr:hypothetical protein [Winogradskyella wandonensis]TCK67977.1 hypothetical protein DFQ05_1761 [Winogradskyella wandonensis]